MAVVAARGGWCLLGATHGSTRVVESAGEAVELVSSSSPSRASSAWRRRPRPPPGRPLVLLSRSSCSSPVASGPAEPVQPQPARTRSLLAAPSPRPARLSLCSCLRLELVGSFPAWLSGCSAARPARLGCAPRPGASPHEADARALARRGAFEPRLLALHSQEATQTLRLEPHPSPRAPPARAPASP